MRTSWSDLPFPPIQKIPKVLRDEKMRAEIIPNFVDATKSIVTWITIMVNG
jgi:hypothetical protein